jgi:hypothetical protein
MQRLTAFYSSCMMNAGAAQIFVFFPEEDKVGVKSIKTFAERMRNEGVSRALMVTQANMTPFARQCLAEMQPKYYIEVVRAPLDCGPVHELTLHHCSRHVCRLEEPACMVCWVSSLLFCSFSNHHSRQEC